jgi:hypothetical protein
MGNNHNRPARMKTARHPQTSDLVLKVRNSRKFAYLKLTDALAGGMNAGNMPGAQFSEFNANAPSVQQKQIEVYTQSLFHQQRMALNNHANAQGMNSGVQGSPMAQQGLDGQHEIFAGNQPRGMPAGAPGPPQGNHALQDYQMQLMLLEQQNKKRLLMARQEQDNTMSGPHAQGGPGFTASMSPQGSRAGPSPNPADQMKKGTPRMGQQGLPGSPMPDGAMQQQRNSPAPAMPGAGFDPNGANMPPGMQSQYGFPGQMPQGPMMQRPPSSHPGNFAGQQLTAQHVDAMQRNGALPNGVWRGPQGQPGMMPHPQQMGPMGNNPQQRGQMPPPPAPPAGEQPRAQEPSPSQPAQPPTPLQGNKAAPKKKATKDNKVKWRAFRDILSSVDIDFRSPRIRKGQIQVQRQQLLVQKSHQLHPRQSHLMSNRSHQMASNSHLSPQHSSNRLQHSNKPQWTSAVRLLATLVMM